MDCSPVRLLRPWDFPGKNTGMGCHFLLQDGILILCNFYFILKEICKVIISLPYFKKKYDEDLPSTGVTKELPSNVIPACVGRLLWRVLCVLLVVSDFSRGFPGG